MVSLIFAFSEHFGFHKDKTKSFQELFLPYFQISRLVIFILKYPFFIPFCWTVG